MVIEGLLRVIFVMFGWETTGLCRQKMNVFVADNMRLSSKQCRTAFKLTSVSKEVLPAPVVPSRRKVGLATPRVDER